MAYRNDWLTMDMVRYEACLRAGMKSENVMTGDQYKVWFRKMIKRRGSGKKDDDQEEGERRRVRSKGTN